MKKNKLIVLLLILFTSVIPISQNLTYAQKTAQIPNYVGVNINDEKSWIFTINPSRMEALMSDLNITIPTDIQDILSAIPDSTKLQVDGTVTGISDEISINSLIFKDQKINYSIVELSLSTSVLGSSLSLPQKLYITVLDPSNNYTINAMYLFKIQSSSMSLSSIIIPFLIVPYNIDWTNFINDFERNVNLLEYGIVNGGDNILDDIKSLENGFEFSLNASAVSTLKSINAAFTYDEKGFLDTGEFIFDSEIVFSINMEGSEDLIPGYDLVIILGINIIGMVFLIYFRFKKKIT